MLHHEVALLQKWQTFEKSALVGGQLLLKAPPPWSVQLRNADTVCVGDLEYVYGDGCCGSNSTWRYSVLPMTLTLVADGRRSISTRRRPR